MKNNHIIIESNLTQVILLYEKKLVIEMLLNDDIQLFFCSNDLKLSRGNNCTYVHYWN
jgi:hypothetical protein